MERMELIERLNALLLAELPQYREGAQRLPRDGVSRRRLLRSLMNVRPPMPLDREFLALQDALLSAEREERGVVDAMALPGTGDPRLALWQGDITRLKADAIVNAANSALLGCFSPCHGCIDNAIHSAAGLQLRDACNRLMLEQGHEEPVGRAKITPGYNLPCGYVIHTVGPTVADRPTGEDCEALAGCYRACLEAAESRGLESVAFCCISTGVFHFPGRQAAQIAVKTVRAFLDGHDGIRRVVFNVFLDRDWEIYHGLLG